MRISDWSSDVCSSDLNRAVEGLGTFQAISCARAQVHPLMWRYILHLNRPRPPCPGRISVLGSSPCLKPLRLHPGISTASVPDSISSNASFRKKHPTYRSEEHTSELQSLMRISYAVFCLKKKNNYYTYKK